MAQEVNKPTLANMTVSEFLMANKAAQGRNGDTMLAHINPREANLLQSLGGSGSVNPYTGLREFYDSSAPGGMDGGMDGTEGDGDSAGGFASPDVNAEPPGMEDFDVSTSFFGMGQPTFSPAGTQSPSGYGVGNAVSSLAESLLAALTLGVVNPDIDGKSLFGADRGRPGVSFGLPGIGTLGPNVSLDSKGLSFDPGLVANTVSEQDIGSFFGSFGNTGKSGLASLSVPSPVSVPDTEETQYAVRDGDLFSVGGGGFRRPYETGLV